MPSTFQDAVTITRTLGLKYLWIDSLCIIQDDDSDWETQSAKMAQIYGNAHLTIAATMSSNCGITFLAEKPAEMLKTVDFKFSCTNGEDTLVRARKGIDCGIHYSEEFSAREWREPLDYRAWALQEQVLATRIVSFTRAELQWSCNSDMTCLCNGTRAASWARFTPEMKSYSPLKWWDFIVGEYTSRKLTFGRDKLPALAGIASRFHEATGFAYLAGLWKDNIIDGLRWHGFRSKGRKLSVSYCAPTFSWASIDGTINYETAEPTSQTHYTVFINGHCTLKGTNPFGEVLDGFLTLQCPVIVARLYCKIPSDLDNYKIYFESYHEPVSMTADVPLAESRSTGIEDTLQRTLFEQSKPILNARVRCLNLGVYEVDDHCYVFFLVLSTSIRSPGSYERIGFAKLDAQEMKAKTEVSTEFRSWVEGRNKVLVTIV